MIIGHSMHSFLIGTHLNREASPARQIRAEQCLYYNSVQTPAQYSTLRNIGVYSRLFFTYIEPSLRVFPTSLTKITVIVREIFWLCMRATIWPTHSVSTHITNYRHICFLPLELFPPRLNPRYCFTQENEGV